MKFLVDNEEPLVDDTTHEFDVIAPIYVGGVPRGFVSPTDSLVCNIVKLRIRFCFCMFLLFNYSNFVCIGVVLCVSVYSFLVILSLAICT